jgi:hypothetical protein
LPQAFFGVGLGFGLSLHHLEPLHSRLYQLAVLPEGTFVLDVVRSQPCLDLVAEPLQFLDLLLEVRLGLLFLVGVGGVVDLLPDIVELLHALSDSLEAAVYLSL